MPEQLSLTPQQQKVVDHDAGPALVFAVAGAGKTTAMVHRIERLVRQQVVDPARILATSFGRANVRDLRRAMAPWPHCGRVDVRTLHSLGRDVIKRAQQMGHQRRLKLNAGSGNGRSLDHKLLDMAVAQARRNNLPFKRELEGMDRQDFLAYVGFCKGNLLYADINQVRLPPDAQKLADQAPAPGKALGWYLDLYRLFEEIRQQRGWITFDDMLLTGWEILATHPDVLAAVSRRYETVLVDEFQDINLAQSEMLDLLTRSHGNYMAIGDDDQTIYEWRGADPRFILGFAQRYRAATYVIDDNFRCPAAPLALANQVIAHNASRHEKQLRLTRGFVGEAAVHFSPSVNKMSRQIVRQIQKLHAAGAPLNEMAVLVRLNAQTPPIEQNLIARAIPYRVSQPFYERMEIETLIQYGRIAWIERQLQAGKQPLQTGTARQTFADAWRVVCNRPRRYLSYDLREQMQRRILRQERPLTLILQQTAARAPQEWLQEHLMLLAEDLGWLANSLEKPASGVLRQLEMRLGFKQFLKETSGFPQTGEGRAASVDAFIAYAKGRGAFVEFMQHIRQLAQAKTGQDSGHREDAVTLTTIHQAKGLEWTVVFVAQCNQEIMPFQTERLDDVEEERRLFYVALTRTRSQLHLHAVTEEELSPFLHEANWEQTITALQTVQAVLSRPPETWQAADALALARHVPAYGLQSYFERWWPADEAEKTAVVQTMHRFWTAVQHHNLASRLELFPEDLVWWLDLAQLPQPEPATTFPGLEKLMSASKALTHKLKNLR